MTLTELLSIRKNLDGAYKDYLNRKSERISEWKELCKTINAAASVYGLEFKCNDITCSAEGIKFNGHEPSSIIPSREVIDQVKDAFAKSMSAKISYYNNR